MKFILLTLLLLGCAKKPICTLYCIDSKRVPESCGCLETMVQKSKPTLNKPQVR